MLTLCYGEAFTDELDEWSVVMAMKMMKAKVAQESRGREKTLEIVSASSKADISAQRTKISDVQAPVPLHGDIAIGSIRRGCEFNPLLPALQVSVNRFAARTSSVAPFPSSPLAALHRPVTTLHQQPRRRVVIGPVAFWFGVRQR